MTTQAYNAWLTGIIRQDLGHFTKHVTAINQNHTLTDAETTAQKQDLLNYALHHAQALKQIEQRT